MGRPSRLLLVILGALIPAWAFAQTQEAVLTRVQQERQPYLETLQELVSIESGSSDVEGLNLIAEVIAGRLRALGGDVELVDPPADMVRFQNTPPRTGKSIVGRFRGTGTTRILLLAHMDTVYVRGMLARQPFRIDGDRAYGLGIADDKHGVALILHTIDILNAMNFRDYGLVTVLINGDEEVSSAGSRNLITKLGSEHDLVLSCEGAGQRGFNPTDHGRHRRGAAQGHGTCSARRRRPRIGTERAVRNSRTRFCRPATCRMPEPA